MSGNILKFGKFNISMIEAGLVRLDGGAMFGVVPRVLWERHFPPDEKNRIQMTTNLLLITSGNRRVLVDTGIGHKFDEKFYNIYAVDFSEKNLDRSLKALGLTFEDITDVILTHLHFDHTGGATAKDPDGTVRPTFPNAVYYVQKQQYEWAFEGNEKDRASYFAENYKPLRDAGQLKFLEGPGEILPGIEVIVVNGHTPAQQLPVIDGGSRKLLFAADLIPTHSHIPVPWVMAYDVEPLTTIEEKKLWLEVAEKEEWLIFFEHDPQVHLATVERSEKGYRLGKEMPFTELGSFSG